MSSTGIDASLPAQMRAAHWTNASGEMEKNLKVNTDASLPKSAKSLASGQTLVKVLYASINPVDYKVPELPFSSLILSKPHIPAMDFAGIVVDSKRGDLKAGQKVFGKLEPPAFGALAEYCVCGKDGVTPLPEGVDPKYASCVGVAGLTAYQCIAPNVKAGQKVFINGGSGGTGTFGIQIAKALGCSVTTSCSGPNVELCKSLGADEVLDYKTQDLVQTLKRSGKQYDLIVDNVGADDNIYFQCHHYLKPEGKYVAVGAQVGLGTVISIMKKFLWPSWLGGGQRTFQFLTVTSNAQHYAQIGQWMKEGKVKPYIEETYSFDEVSKAYARLRTGRTRGKLVIKVSDE